MKFLSSFKSIAILLSILACGTVASQEFPSKQPIRLIVTFSAGGGSDAVARALNTKLGEVLGQTVLVENKPGAGGAIATDYVAKSAPDGYTVLFTVSSHSINQALMPNLPFNTERDLRGVALIANLVQVLVVNPNVPARNLQEWFSIGQKDPLYQQYASGGVGSPGHFAGGLLQSMSNHQLTHIPYKGSGAAMSDIIGNQVPAMISTLSGTIPHIKNGKLKALAITSSQRSPLLPDVPTIAESGVPNYESDTWVGMFVPKATPEAIVQKLYKATAIALEDPNMKAKIEGLSGRIIAGSPTALDALVSKEIKEFTKVVREQKIKPE
jgi:tripartite-type tricarboxylate transporter receptor subunit TctC